MNRKNAKGIAEWNGRDCTHETLDAILLWQWMSTQFGHCKLSPLSLCYFFFIVEFAVLLSIFWAVLAVILSESFP
jgi:hypothetical protein